MRKGSYKGKGPRDVLEAPSQRVTAYGVNSSRFPSKVLTIATINPSSVM
jgi:hypothetical protein